MYRISKMPPDAKGPDITNLQDGLFLLLDKGIFQLSGSARIWDEISMKQERQQGLYEAGTHAFVSDFQKVRNLEVTGQVDEKTAAELNAVLQGFGAFETAPATWIVQGHVLDQSLRPFAHAIVHAFHVDPTAESLLGQATTDETGYYIIRYTPPPGIASVDLEVKVLDASGLVLASKVVQAPLPLQTIDLQVTLTSPSADGVIEGRIVFVNGLPAANITLRLDRVGFGGAKTLLNTATTSAQGLYSLPYTRAGGPARLELFALDQTGKERSLWKIDDISLSAHTIVNLIAPSDLQLVDAEYQRLTADLQKQFGGTALSTFANAQENTNRQDLSALNRSTGWDARVLALAATAARLSAEASLPQEGLYGLFRVGLPTDKSQLARVSADAAVLALNKANESGITSLTDIASFKQRFAAFARDVSLAAPAPGSSSTYKQFLDSSGLKPNAREAFADLYLNHRGADAELWTSAAASISPDDIQTLKRQGQFAYLTTNNAPLTERIRNIDPAQLVQKDFHKPETWRAEITQLVTPTQTIESLIPPAYTGATSDDRLNAYANDMARRVRVSYPTEVIAGKLADSTSAFGLELGTARAPTATFLTNAAAKDFKLGQTPVQAFITANPAVLTGIADVDATVDSIKTLQRVYQMTPSTEAMGTLLSLGLTSAADVVAIPRETFVGRYATLFPPEQADLVHRKAEQISAVTYNLFTTAKQIDSAPPLYVTSADQATREGVKNNLLKQFPTMETLFGSMDFCQCEHCQSILSPAAYLVDLLQFLDPEAPIWTSFLDDWKKTHSGAAPIHKPYDVLMQRRPDIPHIQLTCENTLTVMPYIDIVNEILEYYVAHNALDAAAVNDTGTATSEELLAEPQHVVAGAYNTLAGARYPLSLPFDLWIETVRSFAGSFDTPLWRILHVFRRTEPRIAQGQTYDHAGVIESLGLSPGEYALFTDPNLLSVWFDLYGYDSAAIATTVAVDGSTKRRIDLNSAKTLSRRLGLTYDELLRLVQTGFVNPKLDALVILHKLGVSISDVVFYKDHKGLTNDEVAAFENRLDDLSRAFQPFDAKSWMQDALDKKTFDNVLLLADPDAGCNFDKTTLQYADARPADAIAFLRINLFVRLWRKLGWTIEETDRALTTFLPTGRPLDSPNVDTALLYLAHLKTLDERLHLGRDSRMKLLTFWSPIGTTGPNSLYAQLFLTRGVLKNDPVFDDPLGQYLSPAIPPIPLNAHLLAVQGALGLTANEIEKILNDVGSTVATAELSLETISLLYRYRQLAKGLKLSVGEFITLRQLSGRDPFKALHPSAVMVIADDSPFSETLQFVEIAERIKDIGLSIGDLDYLLRHNDEAGKYRLDDNAVLALIKTLGEGVRAIRAQYAVPDDPGTLGEDVLRQQLGLVLPPDVVGRFLAMLNGTAEVASDDASAFFKKYFLRTPGAEPQSGFLDFVDFDLLFAPAPPDATVAQKQSRLRAQKARLANAFLPYLQKRLIRAFVVQTIAAQTGADAQLAEALLTDTRLLGDPLPLLDAFTATEERGVTASFFASADNSGEAIVATVLADANTALQAGANSALFSAYLEVPVHGAYRFSVACDKANVEAELRFDHLQQPSLNGTAAAGGSEIVGEVVELKAGVPYRFTLDVRKLGGGGARLLVQGETLPKESLAQLTLYPSSTVDSATRALILLKKVLQLTADLGLNEREIRYLSTHPDDFDGVSLSDLPTIATTAGTSTLFTQLMRLIGYARLKRDLAGGMDDLIGIFEASDLPLAKVYPLIATLTRRPEVTVKETAERLFAAPRFADERAIERLWDALQIVERLGVPVSAITEWTKIVDGNATGRSEIARGVREALKARFDEEAWRQMAKPIFDKLRRRQRDALVAHVMHQLDFARMEQLYEHFLIDPGMEPVVQTSRIRLAIASVQLFIQRCLLNLETQVPPSAINSAHWEWMKRYRVWEANRKIFLYPENWLEPEFRDDKTHLFRDLESTLLQGDVSSDLVEDAFFEYMKKLEELARIEPVGMYCDDQADPALNTLHVIGRTFGQPHKFFYRRYEHEMWTPWEPVTADVEGDHLAPVVWRGRLVLFWVTFMDKADQKASPSSCPPAGMTLDKLAKGVRAAIANKVIEAQLHWSEYVNGAWSTRESGVLGTIQANAPLDYDVRSALIYASKDYESGQERGVKIHLGGTFNRTFYLAGRNSVPEDIDPDVEPRIPYSATGNLGARYKGEAELTVTYVDSILTFDGGQTSVTASVQTILQKGTSYTILPCDNASCDNTSIPSPELRTLLTPFFYQDNIRHTFFVEPTVKETTIRNWQGWVPPPPPPKTDFEQPGWWQDNYVSAVYPRTSPQPRVNPDDVLWTTPFVNGSSVIAPHDWLVNPSTLLQFDGELIGAGGLAGMAILPVTAAAINTTVNVNVASSLGANHTVVLTDPTAANVAGVDLRGPLVTVIGSAGLSANILKNQAPFNVVPGFSGGVFTDDGGDC